MRVLLIVNPRSGQNDAALYEYIKALGLAGVETTLRFFTADSELDTLLTWADKYDRVIAAGGDGTVSGVCHLLRDRPVPIVVYPAGTANLTALNLKIPVDPKRLADLTLNGSVTAVDMAEMRWNDANGIEHVRGFIVGSGAGFDAKIMETAAELKSSLGAASYIVGAMLNLTPTVSRFELDIDGRHVSTEGIAALVTNFGGLQFDLRLTRDSSPTDGLLEVIIVRSKTVPQLLPALWDAVLNRFGQSAGHSRQLETYTATRVRIEADPPLTLQYDGEIVDATSPFEVRVLPGAAQLIVP